MLLCSPRGFCAGVDARHRDRRAGARALRRAGLCPPRDRPQPLRGREPARPRARSSSRSSTRCPRPTRRWSSPPTACRRRSRPRPSRRNLFVVDATCPLVTKVHREAERHHKPRPRDRADRPCRPSRGRSAPWASFRRARSLLVETVADAATLRAARSGQPRLRRRRPRCRSTTPPRSSRRCKRALPGDRRAAQGGHLLRHHQPPGGGQGDRAAGRRADRGRRAQLVELAAAASRWPSAHGCRARRLVQRAADIDWALARRRRPARHHRRRLGARGAGRGDHRRLRARATTSTVETVSAAEEEHVLPAAARAARARRRSSAMAVYTDVADGRARRLSRRLRHRRAAVLQGHRRGRRELQLPASTPTARLLHPHALREARRRRRPAVFPRPDGASRARAASPARSRCKNRDGEALGKLAGRPAAIVTFLDGMWIRAADAARIARRSARRWRALHLAGARFRAASAPNALSVDGWRPLYERLPRAPTASQPGLRPSIAARARRISRAHWPRGLPHGRDPRRPVSRQRFFLGDKLSGLIDFYFACTDTLAYDVAICLNAWCFEPDHSFNVTKGARAAAGLRQACGRSSPAERDALPLLARGAALRFLLTRLYDWLQRAARRAGAGRRTRCEYLRKLRFHRGDRRASRDYGLLTSA